MDSRHIVKTYQFTIYRSTEKNPVKFYKIKINI